MHGIIAIINIFFIVLLSGCSDSNQPPKPANTAQTVIEQSAKAGSFKSIGPREAQQLIETRKDLLLLDCRTPQELRYGSIPGSQLVPFWAIMQNKLTLPKDKPIMLICAVGGRSYAAGQILKKQGYEEIYNLSGGITAWKKEGLPLNY